MHHILFSCIRVLDGSLLSIWLGVSDRGYKDVIGDLQHVNKEHLLINDHRQVLVCSNTSSIVDAIISRVLPMAYTWIVLSLLEHTFNPRLILLQ